MKKLLILIFLSVSIQAIASSWIIYEKKGQFIMALAGKSKIKYQITTHGGVPSFIKVLDKGDIQLILYSAGSVGTKKIVKVTRAVIFKADGKKFLGDYPWKYDGLGSDLQPVWSFSQKGVVKITDKESSTEAIVKI